MDHHSGFEKFTHYLNDQEIADPTQVIDDFFRFSSISESRQLLSDWFRILTGEDFDELENCDQDKLLRFFENLEKLVEASYIINSKSTPC